MKAALTQMNIIWESPAENRIQCQRLTKEASDHHCDWIVFPELTLTGFTMNPEQFGENIHTCPPTPGFFQDLSLQYSIGIVFGYIACRDGRNYNHLVMVQNGRIILEYAKLHPFSFGQETKHYTGGRQILTCRAQIPSDDMELCLSGFICYDLRFPEIFQLASKKAELIFVIANWPEERIQHWYALLQARAIENQCFIIGVNRTGAGGGLIYPPSSIAFDPYGNTIISGSAELLYADIHPALAAEYRKEFPLKKDRREEIYRSDILL